MRKRYLATLLLAMLLSVAAACTAFAAEGWAQENGRWVYYLANGSRLTDGWRTGGDGKWRYLDSYGYMATDSWVDDENYYVDSDGVMLENQWLMAPDSDGDGYYDYYYFSSTGKVVTDKWQNINGNWYHFDDEGVMERGWILDDMYYCDENGVMLTGWQRLYPPEDYDEDDNYSSPSPYDYDYDDGKYWFYFNSSGKKAVADDSSGDEITTKKINGTYYAIDEYGALQYGWVSVTGDDSDDIEDYRFVNNDGTVRTGWYSLEPPEYLSNNYEHDVEWFYFNSRGVPTVGPEEGTATTSDFKKISGNTYLFNEKGNPVYGLQKVYTNKDEDEYSAYYFGTFEQSCLLKGKFTINVGGENETYYFGSNGKGYTGVYNNYLYCRGRLQKADSGSKYMVYSIDKSNDSGYTNYVVNTSGRVAKSTTVKDSDDVKYKTGSNGILQAVDDDYDVANDFFNEPIEPDWEYDW